MCPGLLHFIWLEAEGVFLTTRTGTLPSSTTTYKLGQDDAKLLAKATEPDALWPDWCAVWVPEGPGNIFLTMEVK